MYATNNPFEPTPAQALAATTKVPNSLKARLALSKAPPREIRFFEGREFQHTGRRIVDIELHARLSQHTHTVIMAPKATIDSYWTAAVADTRIILGTPYQFKNLVAEYPTALFLVDECHAPQLRAMFIYAMGKGIPFSIIDVSLKG